MNIYINTTNIISHSSDDKYDDIVETDQERT